MFKAFLVPLFALIFPLVAQGSVVVQSTYVAPDGTAKVIRGTGALVSFKHKETSKLFIFTVAHLTGGSDLKISVDGGPANILGQAKLSRQDFALYEIELSGNAKPISDWSFKEKAFTTNFMRNGDFATELLAQRTYRAFEIGVDKSASLRDVYNKVGGIQAPLQPTQFIALAQNFKDVRARAYDLKTGGILASNIRHTPMGRIVFESSIAPGMSGSPIFRFLRNNSGDTSTYILSGFVTQYSRILNYSFGISANVAYELMRSYLIKGARGEQIEKFKGRDVFTRWLHNGSTTYRTVIDAVTNKTIAQESSLTGNAGNELLGDSGEGTNGDGGEGTNGDGGEGTNGDGGSDPKKCSSAQLRGGLILNGEHTEYLKFTEKSGRSVVVQANLTALDFIFRYGNALEVSALQITAEQRYQYYLLRTSLFRRHAESATGLRITRAALFAEHKYETLHFNEYEGSIFDTHVYEVTREGVSGDMQWSNDKSVKTKSNSSWSDAFLHFSSRTGKVNYRLPLADLYSVNLDNVDISEISAKKPFESLFALYSSPRFFFRQTAHGCK